MGIPLQIDTAYRISVCCTTSDCNAIRCIDFPSVIDMENCLQCDTVYLISVGNIHMEPAAVR